jgi:hypothetical protein
MSKQSLLFSLSVHTKRREKHSLLLSAQTQKKQTNQIQSKKGIQGGGREEMKKKKKKSTFFFSCIDGRASGREKKSD